MAFVSETNRDPTFIGKSSTGNLGPGEYYNEGAIHKQAMDAIYPKKAIPFNSQSQRKISMDNKNISPGKFHHFYNSMICFDLNNYCHVRPWAVYS